MSFPNYYATLNIDHTADQQQVREAYKRQSLLHHPDRNKQSKEATKKFQEVADAYYVLSDTTRRAAYDASYKREHATFNPSSTSASGSTRGGGTGKNDWRNVNSDADAQFGDVFFDLLKPEIENPAWFFAPAGTIAGIVLGFIIGNLPGAVLMGYAGNRLGHIRDNKGKSVMEVFNSFSHQRKFAILSSIASKVLF